MHSPAPARLRSALFHVLRALFRTLPIGTPRRDRWRQRFLDRFSGIRPALPRGQVFGNAEQRPRIHAGGRTLDYVAHIESPLPDPMPATLVAFYLPQFHAIPENDAWWGKGFTEWRNVTRALPQFEGHAQPRLPGDLGFYDLRNPQVLRDQAALANAYGIGAFCMYFYWFGGKVLLDAPHRQWLEDPGIALPICLCWANEDWTRTWDGRAGETLIAQAHSAEDDLAFIAHVAPYLRDPRYLRVAGQPLLLIYRPGLLPDPAATAARWRAACRDNGIGNICIGYVQSFERPDPRSIGFDVAVEFPPNLATPSNLTTAQRLFNPDYAGEVLDWRDVGNDYTNRPMPDYRLFPGVNCGWDNEPRRCGRGRSYLHASPGRYGRWLSMTVFERLAAVPEQDRLVFINAWNEWAEGAVLEPDSRSGHAWLDATRRSLYRPLVPHTPRPCLVIHAWYPELLGELLGMATASAVAWRIIVTTAPEKEAAARAVLDQAGVDAELHVYENRGRDILPFLRLARELDRRGEGGVILKVHTKRSPHRSDGDTWRQDLLGALLGPASVSRVLDAFAHHADLGMVAPAQHLVETVRFENGNRSASSFLRCRLGLSSAASGLFASGSMYYVRLEAIRELLDAGIELELFEQESGQIDGTFAHAVERVIAWVVESAGYRLRGIDGAGELIAPAAVHPYPFATSS